MPTLLVIDDDPLLQHVIRKAFRDSEVAVSTAGSAAEGLEKIASEKPDAVALDISLPDVSGLEAFQRIQAVDAKLPIIFITAGGSSETVIEALKLGAYDYLLKPLDLDQLRALVEKAFEARRLLRVPVGLPEQPSAEGESADTLVGRCEAMQQVYKAVGRVASQDETVLILGESGTGKELVARAIYHHSRRANRPFLAVNCAAIPEPLLESELFGHERGAFTGADRLRIGKFEQCTGGTLFLDEIGDMSPLLQSKALRVLQDQRFERVGGNETIHTDVRIIAATNHDLARLAEQGRFRWDLYWRLNNYTIQLPPLRERLEDLPLLVDYFVGRFRRELGKDIRGLAPEALERLGAYRWPGNIRELQSVLKQALLRATSPLVRVDDLPPLGAAVAIEGDGTPLSGLEAFVAERIAAGADDLYGEARRLLERRLLAAVLRHTHNNQSEAARILGITRVSLRAKLRDLGMAVEKVVKDERRP